MFIGCFQYRIFTYKDTAFSVVSGNKENKFTFLLFKKGSQFYERSKADKKSCDGSLCNTNQRGDVRGGGWWQLARQVDVWVN
jgi:hypothetical protein